MRNYLQNFIRQARINTMGHYFLFFAFAMTVLFGSIAFLGLAGGVPVPFGQVATFPLVFWSLTLAHFIARPLVVAHYANVKA